MAYSFAVSIEAWECTVARPAWTQRLRELREKEHLRREDLAGMAHVSPGTVKAYELGLRSPSRRTLIALLDALQADLHTRSEILIGAGFAADAKTPAARLSNPWFTLDEATREVERSRFPAHLSNEVLDVLFANTLMQRVWETDYTGPPLNAFERNFLSVLSHPHVADRLLNWEEALTEVLSMVKGHYGGDGAVTGENLYFGAAMEHFLRGDSAHVKRFLAIWESVPARQRKFRFSYPVVWKHSKVGPLRFEVQVNPADGLGSVIFCDWVPMDAATWCALDELRP